MSLSIKTLGIIGTGAMGRGIAQVAAEAGLRVRLHDTRPGAVTEARAYIERIWARGVEKQRLTQAQAADYAMHLHEANNLENLTDCQLVIEAIVEDLAVKQALCPHHRYPGVSGQSRRSSLWHRGTQNPR